MTQQHSIHDSATSHPWLYIQCTFHPWFSYIPSMTLQYMQCTSHPWLCYIPSMTVLHSIHDSATSHPWLCYIPSMTLLHPILDSAASPSILCYIMSMLYSSHDSATPYWLRYTFLNQLLSTLDVHLIPNSNTQSLNHLNLITTQSTCLTSSTVHLILNSAIYTLLLSHNYPISATHTPVLCVTFHL